MSINLDYYKTFYYVAKYYKISVAAEKLYISQPAVTQTIQKLEDQLGSRLFVRTRKGMELTEQGKMLYEFIKGNIEGLDTIEYRFQKYEKLESGTIKIMTGSNVAKHILYDALEMFSKDYPNVKIEIGTGPVNKSIEMLVNGEIDLLLTYLPYNVEHNNLQIIECVNNEYVFAMSKEYAEENNVKINTIEELNNYSLILPKMNSSVKRLFDEKYKNKITECHMEIAQEQMRKEIILRGCGIGFIGIDEIKDELKSGKIIKIDSVMESVKGSMGIITLKNQYASFATRKLIEYIVE